MWAFLGAVYADQFNYTDNKEQSDEKVLYVFDCSNY